MDLEFKNANDLGENPVLKETVATDTELKEWLVNYVGGKRNPENNEVTVEMIIETIGEEFPEFLLVVAEENWIRGYHQALVDVDTGQKLMEAEESDEQQSS
tara:strand:+ start:1986 stop:2288 length:303 start_codon:yes stop_codon:yes gene_type:complete